MGPVEKYIFSKPDISNDNSAASHIFYPSEVGNREIKDSDDGIPAGARATDPFWNVTQVAKLHEIGIKGKGIKIACIGEKVSLSMSYPTALQWLVLNICLLLLVRRKSPSSQRCGHLRQELP